MHNLEVMFSSKSDMWATPQSFYDELNKEFGFTLDPCATDENHKCEKYYTEEQDGLKQSRDNEIVFCNPPYWREIKNRVQKWYLARGGGCCYALACENRYKPIPWLYLSQIRDKIYQGEAKVLRWQELSTISKYGCYI